MNTILRIISLNIQNEQMDKQEMDIYHDLEHAEPISKSTPYFQNQHNTMMMLISEQVNNEIAISELGA